MVAAVGRLELFLLDEPDSLKRKRQILRSIKARLKNRYGVSIAEVDEHDKWQRSTLGIAFVSCTQKDVESMISKILSYIESDGTVEIMDKLIEYVRL